MNFEINIIIENYIKISDGLKDYPLWKSKFEDDINIYCLLKYKIKISPTLRDY